MAGEGKLGVCAKRGKFGRAFAVDGSDDYSTIPDVTGVTDFAYNENFSVSFWVYNGSGNADGDAIIEKWAGTGGYPYAFRYGASNNVYMGRYDGTNNPTVVGTKAINDSAWHHVVGVKD